MQRSELEEDINGIVLWVGHDFTCKYYEMVMLETHHAAINRNPKINWMCDPVQKHRKLKCLSTAVARVAVALESVTSSSRLSEDPGVKKEQHLV